MPPQNPLDIGVILDRLVTIYRRNFTQLIVASLILGAIALIPAIVLVAVFGFGAALFGGDYSDPHLSPAAIVALVIGALVLIVIQWLATLWISALSARIVGKDYGRVPEEDFSELARRSFDRFGTLALMSFVAFWALLLGFALLILPGIFLLTIWSLVVPVIVFEDVTAMQAFGRSWQIVKPRFWAVLLVFFVLYLILIVVSSVLGLVPLLGNFASAALTPFPIMAATLIYFGLTTAPQQAAPVQQGGPYQPAPPQPQPAPTWAPSPGAHPAPGQQQPPPPPPQQQPHIDQ